MSMADKEPLWVLQLPEGSQRQLFTHTFHQLNYIFLVTASHASMQLQMHKQNTQQVCTMSANRNDCLLQSWQWLLGSGDTEGACCLFVSSSALFPLERYVTAGERRGKERAVFSPYTHPSTSPSSSNSAAVCFHNLWK